jgi:hypothetical protein
MNFMLADVDANPALFAGGFLLVIWILLMVLAIAWLLLPFLILSSLKRLREELIVANKLAVEQITRTVGMTTLIEKLAAEQQVATAGGQEVTNQHLQNIFDAQKRTNQMLDWGADLAAKKTAQP